MDAARSLAHVLELAGFSCQVVHDGLAAQQAAEQLRPAVALLDIGMPKADGHTVARWIRSQPWGSRVTLIAITGWGQESDRAAARDAGFDAHFTKPVDPDELIETLASATAQARGSPAHQNQQSSAPP
jgi:DNA-binding response OmpR family regulator